ncbi:MAG: hypothetical protein JNK49_13860 [Planctomycetes bacterium]|nr:hypothetical protein [Planctomycetota bacterium]
MPPVVVVGGQFVVAGTVVANNIATYDPASGAWSTLGAGTNGGVVAVTTLPNGDLVAAGAFTMAGGVPANHVARWNGATWSPLGLGTNDLVASVTTLPNGDVVAGGRFTTAGGMAVGAIARWDGTNWTGLGGGVTSVGFPAEVYAVKALPNGHLIASGTFFWAGGVSATNIASWNGTSWSALGTGLNSGAFAIAGLANGDVVVGGDFTLAGSVPTRGIARWNGTAWSDIGTSMGGFRPRVLGLAVLPNGDLYALGSFTVAGGVPVQNVARWNGTAWSAVGAGTSGGSAVVALPNGDLVAGASVVAPGVVATGIARWDGAAWSALGAGFQSGIRALAVLPNGDVVAGGDFVAAGGVSANRIARWNGTVWAPLGSGMNFQVQAVAALPNGDVVAGGYFTSAGGVPANCIARWDGATWSPLGTGMSNTSQFRTLAVFALVVEPNGDILAAGSFDMAGGVPANGVARWNGSSWSALGSGFTSATSYTAVHALLRLPSGDLVAGGYFDMADGSPANYIARWNGANWSALGSGVDSGVLALTARPNGDVIAGGHFLTAGGSPADRIARWDGASWSALGAGLTIGAGPNQQFPECTALATLPNGDVVAAGFFFNAGGVAANWIARWNDVSWSAVGVGMSGTIQDEGVAALVQAPNGDLLAGGFFSAAGGLVSAHFARLAALCPATAVPYGAAGAGSAGPMTLRADALPWVGGTFRATTTGIAPNGLAFALVGLLPQSTPLSLLHPAGQPGSSILVSPDVALLLAAAGGSAQVQLAMPIDPVYVGVQLRSQAVQVEVSGASQIVSISSSNALLLTIGSF